MTAAEAACSRKLAKDLRLPEVVAELLCRRGMTSPEEATPFLAPQLAELPSPKALKGLDAAVD
ncbi:MAG: single-stranded-DNA-specific exonuclease RecJ, partial [Candidatus Electrothrix sp. GM3_4]|nr:single-stranded-DNA-specific exonuclease RecJ [Candidatus Electrothrix sp. GM3_4]